MSCFSVVESIRHLVGQYRSFIKNSDQLADAQLREQFERHVNEADGILAEHSFVPRSSAWPPRKRQCG